jgi:putative transcriptional regulator
VWRINIYDILSLLGLERELSMKTRIKELRARYDLTQEDLAKKIGVRRETILFIEKGKYNPSLKLAHDIAKTLQTTIDELFLFEDDER